MNKSTLPQPLQQVCDVQLFFGVGWYVGGAFEVFDGGAVVLLGFGIGREGVGAVSREFGIPAVVGTGNATERVPDGHLLEVDGDAGIVRLVR